MPEVGVATVKVLRRAGVDVVFPPAQTCCGQPFFNSGFRDEAANLAKRTIEILEPYGAIVLPSGSCNAMIRVEYPHLLEAEPEWHERAKKLGEKTFELSEYLFKNGKTLPILTPHPPSPITYHDSCHMCRLTGLRDEPREALTGAGCEIAEMAESDRCCGFGGLFSMRMPEVSRAMTEDKLRRAAETGAEMLVTADPGCLMQMKRIGNQQSPFRLEHIAIVLEELTR
jgi:L-lactate dehydrogenase complex protein LldE